MIVIKQKMPRILLIAHFIVICMICGACSTQPKQGGASSTTLSSTVTYQQTATTPTSSQLSASLRLALPGPLLKRIQSLSGIWQTHMMVRQTVGAKPVVSTNITTRRQWVDNQIYLQEEMTGQMQGVPYYRLGFLTYNNLDQRYEFVTMDHLDTGFMIYQSVGSVDPGNTITLYGHFTEGGSGPNVIGQVIKIRYVLRWENNDSNSEEMYFTRPAAPEYLAVQYTFTRL